MSYAKPDQITVAHEVGQSVMLDNGAYTAWTKGRGVDWTGYYQWCEPWLRYRTTWAVIPDVIGGTEAENDELVEAWPHGRRGAPVWHLNESLDRLERLVAAWPIVCLGSAAEYATIGAPAWHARMTEAMTVCCDEHGVPRAWLHMLRGLDLAGGPYPLASADSTNVARNYKGAIGRPARDIRAMLDELDGRQCPPVWRPILEQLTLDAA